MNFPMGVITFLLRTRLRIAAVIAIDAVSALVAFFASGLLRFNDPTIVFRDYWGILWATTVIVPISFWVAGLYRMIIRRAGTELWWRTLAGATLATLATAAWTVFDRGAVDGGVSRVTLIGFGINLAAIAASTRFAARVLIRRTTARDNSRVLIYGAGVAGEMLSTDPRFRVMAFVDDDPAKWGRVISGVRIHPPHELPTLVTRHNAETVLVALPSANISQRRSALRRLGHLQVKVLTVPMLDEIQLSQSRLYAMRPVGIDELLGRPPVEPNVALMQQSIAGRNVLVTGAGGSIGSELCRQILAQRPHKVVLLEQCEFNLYTIAQELEQLRLLDHSNPGLEIVSSLGSVLDSVKVRMLLELHNVQTLFHAAAYKHVPIVEENECEGVTTNALGTLRVAEAAIAAGVDRFVFVSTDKAVRPTSVMGASKRLAEMILCGLQNEPSAARTRFVTVRFGNVLGSSGSVIPLFREQINRGGPVTVTHPEMTRFFMTIPEASELIIQAGSLGTGGEVFVLDMGEPVQIIDLARRMIALSGRTIRTATEPDGEIEISITGLRPGEKLYEEIAIGDDVTRTSHQGIFRVQEYPVAWSSLSPFVLRIEAAAERQDRVALRTALREVVTEFRQSTDGVVEHKTR
ncbi:MAG: nucleoside-diphosphate sugar epimerase/dehydratase [Planctomycetota bacterium]|nr:nucleoside-diphosphate sugar epimerase/dehydratase [Planctomycetota bacterium]